MIVRLWDQGDVRNLRLTMEAVHAYGSLAGVELFYGGASINSGEARHPFIRERRLLNASEDDYVLGSPTLGPGRPGVTAPPL